MPKPKPRKRLRPRSTFRRWKWVLIPVLVLLFVSAAQVTVVRFVNPPVTLPMLIEQSGAMFSSAPKAPLRYRWIDLRHMPEMFLEHLWISEDQRFFQHEGFDWKEMELAVKEAERKGKPVRGASTITNQCARSIFLWQDRSWIRKGLESYYTIWMELLLPKRRIFELYANVIEMGRGISLFEASSRHGDISPWLQRRRKIKVRFGGAPKPAREARALPREEPTAIPRVGATFSLRAL